MDEKKNTHPSDNRQEWAGIDRLFRQDFAGAENMLQFDQLIFQISAAYIKLPNDQIEMVITRDLERLGRFLEVDRCVLLLLDENTRTFRHPPVAFWSGKTDDYLPKVIEMYNNDKSLLYITRYAFEQWSKGRITKFVHSDELPKEAALEKKLYRDLGVKSCVSVPIRVSGHAVGILQIATTREHRSWPDEIVPRLRIVGDILLNSLIRTRWEASLQTALEEIKDLKARIEADYHFLRQEIDTGTAIRGMIGKSDAFQKVMTQVKQVAATGATVLFLGETGTGKGFLARTVHNLSRRNNRPFMHVNCAALAPTLIESEFFGHEKGAFTGAHAERIGWFEKANGTTLFLDEIGELPIELQAKLLRILQDGAFERVGGIKTFKTDVRVIAATNRDLEKEVEAGRFRQDLWYRMTVFPIHIPPLRARTDDIPLFVNAFVEKYAAMIGKRFSAIPQTTMRKLQQYPWPGNIRELENLIERAVITSPDSRLKIELPRTRGSLKVAGRKTLEDIEKTHILETLENTYWRIQGPSGAAAWLGLNPSTLRARMRKLGIRRPNPL